MDISTTKSQVIMPNPNVLMQIINLVVFSFIPNTYMRIFTSKLGHIIKAHM